MPQYEPEYVTMMKAQHAPTIANDPLVAGGKVWICSCGRHGSSVSSRPTSSAYAGAAHTRHVRHQMRLEYSGWKSNYRKRNHGATA